MKITHHLDDATVVAHAAGTLPEAHAIVAATHLSYCPTCRAALRKAEAVGGSLLATQDQAAVTEKCRAATLARLGGIQSAQAKKQPAVQSELPAVLSNLINNSPLADLNWKRIVRGVAKVDLKLSPGTKSRLQLVRIGPGLVMPDHSHGGSEMTLVLRGSFHDRLGRFSAGDVADLDEDVEHQITIGDEEECICLIATEAPTRYKSFWARLAQPFLGI